MAVSMNDSGSRSSSPENSKEEGELRNGADSSDSDSRDTDTRKSRSRTREKSTSESTSHSRDRKVRRNLRGGVNSLSRKERVYNIAPSGKERKETEEEKVEKSARKIPGQKETSLDK